MHDTTSDESINNSVDKLVVQIQRTIDARTTEIEGEDSESDYFGETEGEDDGFDGFLSSADDEADAEFSVDEMRAELERLMADLRVAKKETRHGDGRTGSRSDGGSLPSSSADAPELCSIPVGPPELPSGLEVTFEMKALLAALLGTGSSTDTTGAATAGAQMQVGFCGMGGIGKTVVSNWLVRHPTVRQVYSKIAWITLGQTPNMVSANVFAARRVLPTPCVRARARTCVFVLVTVFFCFQFLSSPLPFTTTLCCIF